MLSHLIFKYIFFTEYSSQDLVEEGLKESAIMGCSLTTKPGEDGKNISRVISK